MTFKLIELKDNGVRIGDLCGRQTPRFFMINNFGGGGTNVSRFFVYLPLFAESKSELLLNYYYLNTKFEKTPAFNTKILRNILAFSDIKEFIEYARKDLIQNERCCLKEMRYQPAGWRPIVLVDSGSGNIFRDISKHVDESNFEDALVSEAKNYIGFCEKLKFDIAISLDIAGKYTWKKGETADQGYVKKLKTFTEPKWNLALGRIFLKEIPEPTNVSYYAAVHGNSPTDYVNYLDMILTIEKDVKKSFSGFAIGGLGYLTKEAIYEAVKNIRIRLSDLDDDRPIHVLGVGSVQNIIPLSLYGADTFDCHSPWRRASEDKLIVPLFNSACEVIAKNDSYWKYIPLSQLKELQCDCEVCKNHSLSELKRIKNGDAEESIYFRILAYRHNVHQQEVLCELLRSPQNLDGTVERIPKSKYKKEIQHLLASKSQEPLFE
jgi:tRNA-guanine family transglycosylase